MDVQAAAQRAGLRFCVGFVVQAGFGGRGRPRHGPQVGLATCVELGVADCHKLFAGIMAVWVLFSFLFVSAERCSL